MIGADGRVFKVTNAIVALLFALSVVLQYNDPDPLTWSTLYGLAAVACITCGRFPRSWMLAAIVGFVSLAWAASLAPGVLSDFRFSDLFRSMKAETPSIEQSREMLGLLIVAAWMSVLLVVTWRRRTGESR